jgi:zinc protease
MMIKGTLKRSAEQLAREIEQLGGHLHADSGNNSTALSLELLAQDNARGFDLFLEILTQPNFTEKELLTEKRKQLVAIQMDQDQPMSICRDLLKSTLFGHHPYAQSTLGTQESVESITLEDVRSFAATVFQNAAMVCSFAGPQEPSLWLDSLQSRLQPFLSRALPVLDASTPPPDLLQPRHVARTIPKEQAIIQIAFPIPGVTHPDQIALSLLHEALADLGTRLFVRIREQLGLAYFVSASRFLGLTAGYFVFYAGTDPKKKKLVEEAILDEIRLLVREGLSSPELERSRAKLLSEDKIHSQNPAAVVASSALDEYLGLGYLFNQTRQRLIKTTTLDEVNQVVKRYLEKEQYVVATVSPE